MSGGGFGGGFGQPMGGYGGGFGQPMGGYGGGFGQPMGGYDRGQNGFGGDPRYSSPFGGSSMGGYGGQMGGYNGFGSPFGSSMGGYGGQMGGYGGGFGPLMNYYGSQMGGPMRTFDGQPQSQNFQEQLIRQQATPRSAWSPVSSTTPDLYQNSMTDINDMARNGAVIMSPQDVANRPQGTEFNRNSATTAQKIDEMRDLFAGINSMSPRAAYSEGGLAALVKGKK